MFIRTTKSDFARLGRLQIFSLLHNVQVLFTRILGLPMTKMHLLSIRSSWTILILLVTSRQGVEWETLSPLGHNQHPLSRKIHWHWHSPPFYVQARNFPFGQSGAPSPTRNKLRNSHKYVTVSKCFGAPNKKGVMYVAFVAQPKKKRYWFFEIRT